MHLGTIWQVVAWISLPALLILAALLVRRGMHRIFPFFAYYIWTSALMGLIRLSMSRFGAAAYFKVFWITDALSTVFVCFATYELFVKRLFPGFHKIHFYRYLFPAVATILTTIAVAIFLYYHEAVFLYKALQAIDLVRVITLLFFVALMILMGRTWSKYEFGIAFGMSIESALVLASMAIWANSGPTIRYASLRAQLPSVGYDLALLTWLIYFWRDEREMLPVEPVSPEVLEQARGMKHSVKGWLAGRKP
jgi:hypothetical protein